MKKRNPMPRATVTLTCDECGQKLAEISLLTQELLTVLFAIRKEHAIEYHGWGETNE